MSTQVSSESKKTSETQRASRTESSSGNGIKSDQKKSSNIFEIALGVVCLYFLHDHVHSSCPAKSAKTLSAGEETLVLGNTEKATPSEENNKHN